MHPLPQIFKAIFDGEETYPEYFPTFLQKLDQLDPEENPITQAFTKFARAEGADNDDAEEPLGISITIAMISTGAITLGFIFVCVLGIYAYKKCQRLSHDFVTELHRAGCHDEPEAVKDKKTLA